MLFVSNLSFNAEGNKMKIQEGRMNLIFDVGPNGCSSCFAWHESYI